MEAAKAFARQWYIEKQTEISTGHAPARKARTFAAAMDKAIEQYADDALRGMGSAAYIKELRGTVRRLKETSIADVDIAAVDQGVWNTLRKELLKQDSKRTDKTLYALLESSGYATDAALLREAIPGACSK
jgi:serine/threonine-protein kinase RIO1